MSKDDPTKERGVNIDVPTTSFGFTGFPPTIWITGNYSRGWYEDARKEADIENDQGARRREILFSICFLETYLFEWVRDIVGKDAINNYFPYERPLKGNPSQKRYRRPLGENWKKLPEELFNEGKIRANPQLSLTDLEKLIAYRNDLVHAHVSRPKSSSQPKELNPRTSPQDLEILQPGWALGIAKILVLKLHKELKNNPPNYL